MKSVCERCGAMTTATIMSKFNTETICLNCHEREIKHPDYPEADRAETAAVRAGNFTYPGIGCPADLYLNLAAVEKS